MPAAELSWRDPDDFLAAWAGEPWLACLDSLGPVTERARWTVLCRRPAATLSGADCWEKLRALLPERQEPHALPFTAGVIGLAGYGAGLRLENVASRHTEPIPELTAAYFHDALVFDRLHERLFWCSRTGAPPPEPPPRAPAPPAPPALRFTPDQDAESWKNAMRAVIAHIGAGDIFQANLTARWQARTPPELDPVALYRAMRRPLAAPFGGFLRTPEFALLSGSIERFLSLDATGRVETRPIKGTTPIAESAEENARLAEILARDEKENAENLMITDLMRNDIGRVCTLGSVSVPQLCAVERFAHWHHLVSSVRGNLRPGLDATDLLRATLPPGSVTGAPKRQALRIIDRYEASARGAYCGSLFRIGIDGAMDSSVVIRSLLVTAESLTLGAGGGITFPSDPEAEYAEMLLKAAPLLSLFGEEVPP